MLHAHGLQFAQLIDDAAEDMPDEVDILLIVNKFGDLVAPFKLGIPYWWTITQMAALPLRIAVHPMRPCKGIRNEAGEYLKGADQHTKYDPLWKEMVMKVIARRHPSVIGVCGKWTQEHWDRLGMRKERGIRIPMVMVDIPVIKRAEGEGTEIAATTEVIDRRKRAARVSFAPVYLAARKNIMQRYATRISDGDASVVMKTMSEDAHPDLKEWDDVALQKVNLGALTTDYYDGPDSMPTGPSAGASGAGTGAGTGASGAGASGAGIGHGVGAVPKAKPKAKAKHAAKPVPKQDLLNALMGHAYKRHEKMRRKRAIMNNEAYVPKAYAHKEFKKPRNAE